MGAGLRSYAYPYTTYGAGYAPPVHRFYKREADSDADAYTIGQVADGLPYANAVATGHAHNPGYVAYTSFPANNYYNGYAAVAPYSAHVGYAGYAGYHAIGKREADSDADAYTIGQVAAGLPYANAIATGHAHNPGYVAYTSFPANNYYNSYAPYSAYGYGFNGAVYG